MIGLYFFSPKDSAIPFYLLAALSLTGPDRFVGTVVSYRSGHTQDCDAVRALYRNDLLVTA